MTRIGIRDELLRAQTLRAMGSAPYGGADIGECLAAALTCEKDFVTFTAAEGAGDHCEAGARTLFNARALGWLDHVIKPRLVARAR